MIQAARKGLLLLLVVLVLLMLMVMLLMMMMMLGSGGGCSGRRRGSCRVLVLGHGRNTCGGRGSRNQSSAREEIVGRRVMMMIGVRCLEVDRRGGGGGRCCCGSARRAALNGHREFRPEVAEASGGLLALN